MMTRQERAKQFAPFDAMKGLQEALREREAIHERVERRELSEEDRKAVENVLKRIRGGTLVDLIFYGNFREERITGPVTEINTPAGFLKVSDVTVWFEDIYLLRTV